MAVLGRLNSFTWFIYTQGGSHRTTSSSDYQSQLQFGALLVA